MVESPMMRRMMGADASDELAKLVLGEFSFKIRGQPNRRKRDCQPRMFKAYRRLHGEGLG